MSRYGSRDSFVASLTRLFVIVAAAGMGVMLLAPAASAHPLGNFTVNSFSGLYVQPQSVAVQLVVDSAEIPTVQKFPEAEVEEVAAGAAADYGKQECDRLRTGVRLELSSVRQELAVTSNRLEFLPGQAGLPTMRLTCELRTADDVDTTGQLLEYVDQNSLGRTGWREITLTGDGVRLAGSTAASTSVSSVLTDYPNDLLTSPLDQRSARARVTSGDGIVTGAGPVTSVPEKPSDNGMGNLTDSFTRLVSARDLGPGLALFALGLSILLGALHAFAPGHGKTLMAAYLLGQRNSLRQVGIIGLTVTLTHTAGVLVLGLVLSAVALTAPERIYGWLGLASGLLLLGIGVSLLRQARRRAAVAPQQRVAQLVTASVGHPPEQTYEHAQPSEHFHDHDHDDSDDHPHDHDHSGGHSQGVTHSHGWGGSHTHPAPATSARGMIAVGFAGGMVPSPSALIVLLGGIALGRTWFGVLLVLGYGIGMALALIGTGLALARARDHVERWAERHRRNGDESSLLLRLTRTLPTATALLVVVVGVGLSFRSALVL
ncbi:MAG: High-affinity nickel-transporter [Actinomycetota bacterium]|nr:High-affinity nickel-transporter [Actinomycetota bacterium]